MKSDFLGYIEASDAVYTVIKKGCLLQAGEVCNAGFCPLYEVNIDDYSGEQEALEAFFEIINE